MIWIAQVLLGTADKIGRIWEHEPNAVWTGYAAGEQWIVLVEPAPILFH